MFTATQIVLHAVGDYVLQSDWMANEKTKKSLAAWAHAITYALPFLLLRPSVWALLVILVSHFIIDRWRLARYVVWAKNFLSPPRTFVSSVITDSGADFVRGVMVGSTVTSNGKTYVVTANTSTTLSLREALVWWHKWEDCSGTGYHKDRPAWMAVWLMIIADNVMHVTINAFALRFL
jgi:hypothetical protein